MDKLQLTYNDRTLFHLLRHLSAINENALACLLKRGYDLSDIEKGLQLPGSKFHASFATDIKSLLAHCDESLIQDSTFQNGYQHYIFQFDGFKYPKGIGTVGIISLEALKSVTTEKPFMKENRGLQLLHARVKQMPVTNTMTLVIKQQQSSDFLITAFPGTPALPIPKVTMNADVYAQSLKYWSGQVFLEMV